MIQIFGNQLACSLLRHWMAARNAARPLTPRVCSSMQTLAHLRERSAYVIVIISSRQYLQGYTHATTNLPPTALYVIGNENSWTRLSTCARSGGAPSSRDKSSVHTVLEWLLELMPPEYQ